MISDEEARDAVENIVTSTQSLHGYCKDHDCAKCQFREEHHDEFYGEYVCSIWDIMDVRWRR